MFTWYRGWTMVGLGILMVMLSVGSITYGYSIYVTPVSKELGLSRETINSGIVVQHLGTALVSPLIGRLLDHVRVNTMIAVGGILMGGGMIGLSIGDALWPKALMLALPISLGFVAAGTTASYVLVGRWFKYQRGRAMTLVALGQSAGSIFFAPFVGLMVEQLGWRQALLIQGLLVAGLLIAIAFFIRDRPREDELEPAPRTAADSDDRPLIQASGGKPLALRDILSSPTFWLLAVIVALTLAVVQATIASLVPLATGRGIALAQASTLLAFLGISAVIGKIALAVIADRVDRRTVMIIQIAIIMAFTLSLTVDLGFAGLALTSALAGMALGGFFPVYSALLADIYGANSLGSTEGLVAPVIATTSAFAIYIAGVTFDATGDYSFTFILFSAALLVALVLALFNRFGRRAKPVPRPV